MDQQEPSLSFAEIAAQVFKAEGDAVFIGGEEVTPQLRAALRDEAEAIAKSRLWEIFNAAIVNEGFELGVVQSKDWEHVQFAKALLHWAHFFRNTLFTLAKPSR